MKRVVCALLVCLLAAPARAQEEVVSAVKNDLVARHVDLSGPCGAFEITKRVAWVLRSQGVGLLEKSGGNNCQGYSTDWLVFADGSGRDILGDSGGANTPAWSGEPNDPAGTYTARWRAPFDPGDVAAPPPVTAPPASGLDQQILDRLIAHEAAEAAEREKAEAFRQAVGHEWAKFGKFLAKYGPIVLGALFGGKAIWGE